MSLVLVLNYSVYHSLGDNLTGHASKRQNEVLIIKRYIN